MWNDASFAYMFTGSIDPSTPVTAAHVTIRKGLRIMPIEIDLRDQPLP